MNNDPIFPGCKVTEKQLREFVRDVCELRHRNVLCTGCQALFAANKYGLTFRPNKGKREAAAFDFQHGNQIGPFRPMSNGGPQLYTDLAEAMEKNYMEAMRI